VHPQFSGNRAYSAIHNSLETRFTVHPQFSGNRVYSASTFLWKQGLQCIHNSLEIGFTVHPQFPEFLELLDYLSDDVSAGILAYTV
jgi:hypothetical protein